MIGLLNIFVPKMEAEMFHNRKLVPTNLSTDSSSFTVDWSDSTTY